MIDDEDRVPPTLSTWIECKPCTCEHAPQEHGLYGCHHRYLSDPACMCTGVFHLDGQRGGAAMTRCEHRCEQCERNSVDGAVHDFIAYEANRRQLAGWMGVDVSAVRIRFAEQTESFATVVYRAEEAADSVVAVMDGGQLVFYKLIGLRVPRRRGD